MHVQISIFHRGWVRWELAAWLAWLVQNERRRAFSITYHDGRTYGGRPVDSNRNRAVRERPAGADLLMIDADTIPPNRLFDICLAGLDVCLAPVPIYRADNPDGPAILNFVPLPGRQPKPLQVDGLIYQEILDGGAGVLYASDKALRAVGPAPFRFGYDGDGVAERGEDYEFCRRAREAGIGVYAALDLLCGHAVEVNMRTIADSQPACDAGTRRLQVVVTGTGRSGTGFAAHWLTSAGLPCGHELFFTLTGYPGAVDRLRRRPELVGDASWLAAPWLMCDQLTKAAIIHQVRHPRAVIESCLRHPPGTTPAYLAYLEQHCPPVRQYADDLNKAAARWLYWNERIEQATEGRLSYFWRVEDGEAGLLAWLKEQGLVDPRVDGEALYGNRQYNRHRPEVEATADWDAIAPELQGPLAEMMGRYGYEWTQKHES